MINSYAQIQNDNVIYIVPKGGILDESSSELVANNIRAQFNYNTLWRNKHELTVITGTEVRERNITSRNNRVYGFNMETLSFANVDLTNSFPLYAGTGNVVIPSRNGFGKNINRFVSIYGNGAYTFDKRYTISGSVRKDATNQFGVDFNDKWKSLWSVGGSWNISNESFYKTRSIPYLRMRLTYGYQGNVNNSLAPYTIINRFDATYITNAPYAIIYVPANPDLSWETVSQLNLGVDFRMANNRISGAIELYNKKSSDLIFNAIMDPTTGIKNVTRNSADMTGKGADITLNIALLNKGVKCNSQILFSYVANKVTDYKLNDKTRSLGGFVSGSGLFISPIKGHSPYEIYSYPFAGLDPATGDPQGYLGKIVSKAYYDIIYQSIDTANLISKQALPPFWGYFNNTFSYKGLTISASISYRFGYYFTKRAISYNDLYYFGITSPDFSKRWQKPGDESKTTVPSMIYPPDSYRDQFYAGSSANLLRGDNVRLDFVRISYDFVRNTHHQRFRVPNIQIYVYANNLGFIWRANKEKLDPDYGVLHSAFPETRSIAAGLKLNF